MTRVQYVTLATALGSGLSAGVFFAFSSFVMGGLKRLPPAQGIAAMQSINRVAVTPAFMTALFGTAVSCTYLGVHAVRHWDERPSPYLLAGSALFLVGAIGLTVVHHVPLNDALDAVSPGRADAAERWSDYLDSWTTWNHVRAVTALAAAGSLTLALRSS